MELLIDRMPPTNPIPDILIYDSSTHKNDNDDEEEKAPPCSLRRFDFIGLREDEIAHGGCHEMSG